MADKKYRLSFEMTDGTKQSVEFAVPQGESVTPDYAAAEGEPGHILNRTHWVEKGGMVEILPDTTIEYNEDEGYTAYTPSLVLEVGKTYIVKWNGTEYTCVGQDVSALIETEGAVALGNLSDYGLNGNGEPFALIWVEGVVTAATDTTDPITISIKTEREIVHKLPGKFLPDGVPYMEKGEMVEILPETTITLIDAEGLLPQTIEFTKGDTYKVKWNGTEYECIADTAESDEYGTSSFIGNTVIMDGEDNGMPFALATIPGIGTAVFYLEAASGESEVVLSISGPTVHKLDPKYLPDTMLVHLDAATMTADKTSNEIMIAMRNRQSVFLVSNNGTDNGLLPCVSCEPKGAFFLLFSATSNGDDITAINGVGAICVKPDGSVISG